MGNGNTAPHDFAFLGLSARVSVRVRVIYLINSIFI